MSTKNYLMYFAYDGRDFYGYQKQVDRRTVQGEIEEVLSFLFKANIITKASGRTDAGVHALNQVLSFKAPEIMDITRLSYVLGRHLPRDIKINSIYYKDLHPRFDAVGKTYIYKCSYEDDLFLRPYTVIIKKKMDLTSMKKAAQYLEGEHDFYNFSNRRIGEGSTLRNLYKIRIVEVDAGFSVEFTGDGFLYKMVRIIMAYLLKVGQGAIDPQKTPEIMMQKDRKHTRQVAPPQGLYLQEVFFDKKELEKHLIERKTQ